MAREDHPRIRQANKLKRKIGRRDPADRILIISEGTKTEPHYFSEIRQSLRLSTANINVLPSKIGTSPDQVVKYARDLFISGDTTLKIRPKAFEKVYAVFDRDDHVKYTEALQLAQAYNNKKLRNDQKRIIEFKAIVSVPNFELWLLLHFENCRATMHRDEVVRRLKAHLQDYEKGQDGNYGRTKEHFQIAKDRAIFLSTLANAWDGNQLYTDVHVLVEKLIGLKSK